jgi:tetratricopeptide (TPR) repeat protein
MYKNACSEQRKFDPDTAESLADVLYEMGKSLLGAAQYNSAIKWLDRALEILADQELEKLSMDASDLRISIIQSTVKARIHLKDEQSLEQARDHINLLENELGDRLIVLVLHLEILEATPVENFDSTAFSDVLGRIIRSAVLNNDNFRLVMFHIRKLNAKNQASACKSLSDLLRLRIMAEGADERRNWMIEKALITRVWMAVGQRDTLDTLSTLEDFLNTIVADIAGTISSTASLAAHTVRYSTLMNMQRLTPVLASVEAYRGKLRTKKIRSGREMVPTGYA